MNNEAADLKRIDLNLIWNSICVGGWEFGISKIEECIEIEGHVCVW